MINLLLESLEQDLQRMVFGQDQRLRRWHQRSNYRVLGLREPETDWQLSVSGSTGVGKPKLPGNLSEALGVKLIRFDMSEYMERHTVSRLIGAPPGYGV